MTEVKSKSELKAALERGETEFHTTNKNLLYACALVSKFKDKSSLPEAGSQDIVIDGGTIIAITIAVLTTAVALYAIFKDYDIEVDIKKGRIIAKRNRS
jgi:hypothetical protein